MGESTSIFMGVRSEFFLSHVSMKFLCANRIATPSAASHLGLCCLPMSHKTDARLNELKTGSGAFILHTYSVVVFLKNMYPCLFQPYLIYLSLVAII